MASFAASYDGNGDMTITAPETAKPRPARKVSQDFILAAIGYRANRAAVLHRAIDRGIEPTPRGLAAYTGLHINTCRRVLSGGTVSAPTMARVFNTLANPGESVADLFEPVTEEA